MLNIENDPLWILNLNDNALKTLGLFWCPRDYIYQYKVNNLMYSSNINTSITKINMLSTITTICDSLCLTGLIIVAAKIFVQRIWQLQISWDDLVQIANDWQAYYRDLPRLRNTVIPWRIIGFEKCINIQVHGFADL